MSTETKRFYSTGDCVRVRRIDETTSEHDEFIADARSADHARDIAEALNEAALAGEVR